jgi:hypothetical protein
MSMEQLRSAVTAGLAAAALAWLPGAHAQHADIGLSVEAGQIVAGLSDEAPPGAEVPIDRLTSRILFEGHLEDFIPAAPPFVLIGGDDPGFEAEAGTFTGNLALSFTEVTTLGSGLLYWDPGTGLWGAAPGNTTLHLSRSLGATVLFDTTFSAGGVSNDPNAQIGRTDPEGAIHSHVPYTLDNVAGDTFGEVPVGAYLVSMYLSAAGYQSSDPFSVVLNAGLDDEVFEAALMARAVPEPETYLLMFVGLAAVGWLARRRSGDV